MYYIFKAETSGNDELTFAKVIGKMPNFLDVTPKWSWFSDSPLPVSFPDTTFSIDETVYQDAYNTGSIFDIHSEKLANLVRASGVRCEYFPVNVISRKSGKDVSSKYFTFHLMETYSTIDYTKSTLTERFEPVPEHILNIRNQEDALFGKNITSLKLTDEVLSRQSQLFRDEERPHLVFVHEKLKQSFDASSIQGCKFTHYEDYRDISVSDIFDKNRTLRTGYWFSYT